MNTTLLADAPIGQYMRIHKLQSSPEVCHRLREMGFCENALVRCMVNVEGNIICEICHARVGLNSLIAQDILVAPLH